MGNALRAKCAHINSFSLVLCEPDAADSDSEHFYYHIMNYDPVIPVTSECDTCFCYFLGTGGRCWEKGRSFKAMVVVTVRELRSLQLQRRDLTTQGLTAILDKCPHLNPDDILNCRDDNAAQHKSARINCRKHGKCAQVKTKALSAELFRNWFDYNKVNPEGLDIRNCHNIMVNKGCTAHYDRPLS